jgi:xanthine/CO dehydrogenase XdhC/CoxF family maturation factor
MRGLRTAPEEIVLSIMAEIVAVRRQEKWSNV